MNGSQTYGDGAGRRLQFDSVGKARVVRSIDDLEIVDAQGLRLDGERKLYTIIKLEMESQISAGPSERMAVAHARFQENSEPPPG